MKKLIIFAHPMLHTGSVVNKAIFEALKNNNNIDYIDLSSELPNWSIGKHQDLMQNASEIIIQTPFYWFSVPGMFKTWLDMVLTPNWAYGNIFALEGKKIRIAITSGQAIEGYAKGNPLDLSTVDEFLNFFKSSMRYIKADYQEPYHIIGSTVGVTSSQINEAIIKYKNFLAI